MNNTVRRHPRTLEEAFGPGERGPVFAPPERTSDWPHFVAMLVIAAVTFASWIWG